MTRSYVAYGCIVETPLRLDAYLPAGDRGRFRIVVDLAVHAKPARELTEHLPLGSGHGRKLCLMSDRPLRPSSNGQRWCFEVSTVARFHWSGGQNRISVEPLRRGADVLLAFWLIHILLPLFLTLEMRYEMVHACAVEAVGRTVLFAAPSHGGKSTLTDHFLDRGHTLVSDDKVATYCEDGLFYAVPSHPNHRPYRKFEDLGRRVQRFSALPRPIDAIYALRPADPAAQVVIEPVSGHRKFAALRPSYLFEFRFLQERRLRYLSALLSAVPVYRVSVPWDLSRVREVHDRLMGHHIE